MLLCILAVGQRFGREEGQLQTCLHLVLFFRALIQAGRAHS